MTKEKEKNRKRILAYRDKYPEKSRGEYAKALKLHVTTIDNHIKEIEKKEELN